MSQNKKVLIVVTSHDRYINSADRTGYWLEEVTHFYHEIAEAGYTVDFVSPKGGTPPLDAHSGSKDDPANQAFWADAAVKHKLDNTLTPEQVSAGDYAAIYYAGGHGAMWDFHENERLNDIAQQIYGAGGVVSAICHGVAGVLNLKQADGSYLIEAQPLTGFSNFEDWLSGRKNHIPFLLEDELKKRNAHYGKSLVPFTSHVVVGNRLLTGQNPQSGRQLGRAFVELMKRQNG
jgi:putative intracellular protease/amidase